jgi:ribosomal protein S7
MNQASPQTINQTIHKQLINQTIDQTTVGKQSKAVRSTNQSINQIQNQSDTDPISTHVNLKDETLSNQAIHQ